MTGTSDNYWSRTPRRLYARRTFVRGAAWTGVGLAGALVVGCGSTNNNSSGKPNASAAASVRPAAGTAAPAASAAGAAGTARPAGGAATAAPSGVAALIGRTATAPPAAETPARGGTYVVASGINPPSLDPHKTTSSATFTVVSPVMSRLLRPQSTWDVNQSNDRTVIPDLALSVESPDAVTWTLKLRPDAKFQNVAPVNGHPVEADDIKVTFQRALDAASVNHGSLSMIDPDQISAPDKNTVVFKLKYPFASFTNFISSGNYGWIFPREIAGGGYDPTKTVIGSGPFLWDTYTPDVTITWKRNPDYYNKDLPYVDGVKQAIVPDPNQQYAQFTAGNIDQLANIAQANLPTYQKALSTADTITNWGPGDGQIYFNLSDPASPFKDQRVRQAVSLALNRTGLSQVAFEGKSEPCFYAPLSFGKWSLRMDQLAPEAAQFYKFDLQKAKQLMDAAGGASFNIQYTSPTPYPPTGESPSFKALREASYNMVQSLPSKINLVLIDYNKDWVNGGKGVRYGNYPANAAIFGGLEGHTDVDEYLYTWYGSQSAANLEHLQDKPLDDMILKARATVNEDERVKAYLDIQKYMAGQMFSVAGNPNGLQYTMVGQRVRNQLVGDTYGVGTAVWANLWLKK